MSKKGYLEDFEITENDFHQRPQVLEKPLKHKFLSTANIIALIIVISFILFQIVIISNYFLGMFKTDYVMIPISTPDFLISMVSTVLGFYFGKSFNLKE